MLNVKEDRSVPVQLHRLLLPNSLYALFHAPVIILWTNL